jgi:hypothetical protein
MVGARASSSGLSAFSYGVINSSRLERLSFLTSWSQVAEQVDMTVWQ